MRKPRILRIINRFNLGGPTYNVAYLTKYMEDEFETLLVGGAKDETEESSEHITESLGLKPIIIPEMKREIDPKSDRIAYKKIKDIIKEFQPDIVHTHASKAGAIGRLAASKMKVPVVVHTFHGHVFHSYFGKFKTAFYKNVERTLAKRSTKIIAISNIQKQELSETFKICKPDKMEVVPLGFDLERFRDKKQEKKEQFFKDYNVQNDEVVISIVGRLVPIKNHQLFLKALKYVVDNTKVDVRAFIVGDGESRAEIEAMADELGLFKLNKLGNPIVTLTSWIKDVDVVYAATDIAMLTSFNEGTPVSLIEAQAAGVPIISTEVGGINDVVLRGQSALLSNVNDEMKICKDLLTLVNNKDLRESMSGKGEAFVMNNFSYHVLVNNTKNLYHKLLQKPM